MKFTASVLFLFLATPTLAQASDKLHAPSCRVVFSTTLHVNDFKSLLIEGLGVRADGGVPAPISDQQVEFMNRVVAKLEMVEFELAKVEMGDGRWTNKWKDWTERYSTFPNQYFEALDSLLRMRSINIKHGFSEELSIANAKTLLIETLGVRADGGYVDPLTPVTRFIIASVYARVKTDEKPVLRDLVLQGMDPRTSGWKLWNQNYLQFPSTYLKYLAKVMGIPENGL